MSERGAIVKRGMDETQKYNCGEEVWGRVWSAVNCLIRPRHCFRGYTVMVGLFRFVVLRLPELE